MQTLQGWPWPSPGGRGGSSSSDPPLPPPAPLLLVPGVCGTMLAVRPAGSAGDGERCWVDVRSADASYKHLWGRFSKQSGRVELLAQGLEACVPRGPDDSGLYPISVLDPDIPAAVASPLRYFEQFIAHVQTLGYTPGLSLFGAGYDFRQSCRDSAQTLLARLEDVSRRNGGSRVDVVTHSMAGLVVRSLLADHPEDFERLVRRWVAIGCPFGGAPGYTIDALMTGVQWGGSLGDLFFVKRETFRQAALQCPSVYELLPHLSFPWQAPPPQLVLWLKQPIPQTVPSSSSTAAAAGQASRLQCPQCGACVPLAGTPAASPVGAAGTTPAGGEAQAGQLARLAAFSREHEEPLPCSAHSAWAVPSPQPSRPAGGSSAFSSSTAGSTAACGSSSSGGVLGGSSGGTCSSSLAGSGAHGGPMLTSHQYIFHHDLLPGLLGRLLKDNAVSVGGASVPLPFDPELWARGQDTHSAWAGARLPWSCEFFNIYGSGVSSPYDAEYGTCFFPLQDLDAVPHASAAFTYVDGDGTVPTESATAHGLEAAGTVAVPGVSHRDLVGSTAVWDQALAWLRRPEGNAGRQGSERSQRDERRREGSEQQLEGNKRQGEAAAAEAAAPAAATNSTAGEGRGMAGVGEEAEEEEECFWNPLAWQVLLA